jgi:hypothetical protein
MWVTGSAVMTLFSPRISQEILVYDVTNIHTRRGFQRWRPSLLAYATSNNAYCKIELKAYVLV